MQFPRSAFLAVAVLILSAGSASARWCSFYDAYSYNCGFQTLAQCRANISGMGGVCRPDAFQRSYERRTEGRGYTDGRGHYGRGYYGRDYDRRR